MRDLPTGTVTFLFTDIEGSTRLLAKLGPEAYAAALDEHRRILREAFGRHGGVEVDTQGDAFFVAFPSPAGAAAAAGEAQTGLAPCAVAVRMGLHTGTPHLAAEGYVGEDVHLGARVAASGHGGQVLLTRATAELIDVDVLDLGEHRLKDFAAPVSLFQLGEGSFPPLKTLSNTNLPRPASSFVGREREVAEVAALVRGGARLLTLTGPGGSGKTRLAIEAAAELIPEFKAGVFWVGLASLRDAALVPETVAQTLGAKQSLSEHIGERELLLLLDNLEQVVAAASQLASLVEACPNLMLLVTSRELLRVRGEVEYQVLPLAEPDAVELFCARAQVEPNASVQDLCRRLDNMPLALELAAARASVLTVEQIHERLSQRLDLFKGGRDADPRQQTLRATIEWSHDLLSADEQRLFARLAIFVGGCTLEAAEGVADAGLDTLQSLVEKSLLRHTQDRFWMLETILEFAVERLEEDGEAPERRRRAAEYFLDLAESAGLTVEAVEDEQPQRHDVARADLGNLRAALDWALEHDPQLGVRLAVALEQFWATDDPREGARWFDALLARTPELPVVLRARAARAYGGSLQIAGDGESSRQRYAESLELFRLDGDEHAVAHMQMRLATALLMLGDVEGSRELLSESLVRARALDRRLLEALILGQLGYLERHHGSLDEAFELLRASAEVVRQAGFAWYEAAMLDELAGCALDLGRLDEAEDYARRSIEVGRRVGDPRMLLYALGRLAGAAARRGDAATAGRFWGAVEGEEGRGVVSIWEGERDRLTSPLEPAAGPEFEQARVLGRRLTLDDALDEALSGDSPS